MELNWCSAHRMAECQSRGMEGLPRRDALELFGDPSGSPRNPTAATPAVHRIAHNRVTDVLQVHPDLVGPAGVKLNPEQIGHPEPGYDEGVRARGAALGGDRHPLPVLLMSSQRGIDPRWAGV